MFDKIEIKVSIIISTSSTTTLGGATKNLLGGKYMVDNKSNHDCSNCPSFLSREEEEDHLELINRVRDNVTSQLRRGEGDLQELVGEQQKEECGQCGKRYARRGMVKHM